VRGEDLEHLVGEDRCVRGQNVAPWTQLMCNRFLRTLTIRMVPRRLHRFTWPVLRSEE
jgi:hypothetical protein